MGYVAHPWWLKRCARCGRLFDARGRGPGAKYCLACAVEVKRERARRARERRKERGRDRSPRPKLGDKCKWCGYDIHYALEYHHTDKGDGFFLCASCHSNIHGKTLSLSPTEAFLAFYPGPDCFLCSRPGQEKHHIVPRSKAPWATHESKNLIVLCSNCHRIVTKFGEKWFREWFERFYDGRYRGLGYDWLQKASTNIQFEVRQEFYLWLREKWSEIEERLRKGLTELPEIAS